jgi:hypothetical protein
MFKGIALRQRLARFVNFKDGAKEEVATEYLWASLQTHRVVA